MRDVYRILDANFNRAREAMRVAEDFARFILSDPALSASVKQMRSDLQKLYQALPAEQMLAARDTDSDVGTIITSDTEGERPTPASVAQAACKRLPEALRTIEEYLKLVAPAQAASVEQLRYRSYTFEKRLLERAGTNGRFNKVRLYVLLTSAMCRRDPLEVAEAAIAGGADCIQLREKEMPAGALLALARRLREITSRTGTLLIINDRPDIADLCGADGVHVGQDDLSVAEARKCAGPGKLVGMSTHTIEQARAAVAAGADYIGVGPMFHTSTKDAGPLAGPEFLKQVAGEISLPFVAIGGITPGNVEQLVAAGANRLAVCGAIISADDPEAAARAIKQQLSQ